MALATMVTRLDGLAALPVPERAEELFALRTLGVVREDEELVRLAQDRFRGLGLEWHAAQTRALL